MTLPNFEQNHPKLSTMMFSKIPNSLFQTYVVKKSLHVVSSIINGKNPKKFSHFTNLEVKKESRIFHWRFTVICGAKNSLFTRWSLTNQFQRWGYVKPYIPINKEWPHASSKAYYCLSINSLHKCQNLIYIIGSKNIEWAGKSGAYCRLSYTSLQYLDNLLHLTVLMGRRIKQFELKGVKSPLN